MIAVIDVTGNNLKSLTNAIERLGYDCHLTHDKDEINQASHVILPGVGTAKAAMIALKDHQLIDTLSQLTKPLLGICLGMQLLFEHSEEGDVDCLNLIPGRVKRLPKIADHPVPHMGWSRLNWTKPSPLSEGLTAEDYVYFVHSYALFQSDFSLASCNYAIDFTAIFQHQNRFGMQFHPEKSADTGLKLLDNFLKLEGVLC
ncbi:MAG: imidazole glycerol phosphate synthase subunit HisH [Tatlockia sp.]|nr:imidazole glycerol phosphate synthase subunit HisH [Tatlockia sp.]